MHTWIAITVASLAAAISPSVNAAVGTALSVSITPSEITVTGVTPGADVLFYGAGFEPKRAYAVLHRWSSVVVDDGHGTVTYSLDRLVNWNALWIVADLRNGHYTIAATPGFPIDRERLTKREFKRDLSSQVTRFLYSRTDADLLYLEPGGACTFSARDGDPTDLGGTADGTTEVDLLRFQPVIGTATPRAFTPGGTLFVIDPSRLDLLELRIDGSMLAGAH